MIEPAVSAMIALTLTLMTIWIRPSTIDCVSTLPCAGSMNCGSSARYSIAIFGFSKLVTNPIANSLRGLSTGNSRTWNGERPFGFSTCHASHSRYNAPPSRSAS